MLHGSTPPNCSIQNLLFDEYLLLEEYLLLDEYLFVAAVGRLRARVVTRCRGLPPRGRPFCFRLLTSRAVLARYDLRKAVQPLLESAVPANCRWL
jgi:hypothetical protein